MTNEAATEITSNIVELENGEKVNFGKNGKLISVYDLDSGVITFKTVTGHVITVDVAGIPAEVMAEAAIYGIREKIKSTLAPVPAEDLADKIAKEIAQLQAGKFVTRSSESGAVELDSFMTAFALVNATGVVDSGAGTFPVPAPFITVTELKPHWKNVKDVDVINEVLAFWESLDRKKKANQKRTNTFVNTQAAYIETGVVTL